MNIEISLFGVLVILLVVNFILVNLLNWAFRLTLDSDGFIIPIISTIIWLITNLMIIESLTFENQQKPSLLIKTEVVDSIQYYSLIKDDKVYDFITFEEADSLNKIK